MRLNQVLDLSLRLTRSNGGPMIDIERAAGWWADGNDRPDFVRLRALAKKHITDALNRQIRVSQSPT